jgi:hypothetical protein
MTFASDVDLIFAVREFRKVSEYSKRFPRTAGKFEERTFTSFQLTADYDQKVQAVS